MFLCVSPNPAIDKRMMLRALIPGEIHRARAVQNLPGGKATHVAMVLKAIGCEPHWIGLCGGATGEQLITGLRSLGIVPHSVSVCCETRTNLELIDDSGAVTEIREPGGPVSSKEVGEFERDCKELFQTGGESVAAIFSGSLPPGAPGDLYAGLITSARKYGCRTLLDAGGEPLRAALSARPDFVKPNRDEAAAVVNFTIDSIGAAAEAVRQLMVLGARSAAVSLGADGLVYSPGEDRPMFVALGVPVKARSTVGCGDAALAGFAHSFCSGATPAETLSKATACATANCLAESPGAVRAEVVQEFEAQVRVETLLARP